MQKGATGTSSGLWTKFYFLACGDDYKLVSLVYFLHKCQSRGLESHPSSQIFLWLTWHGIKSKVLTVIYKALKTWSLLSSCSPTTQDTWGRLLLKGHPAPCVFSLESSAPSRHHDSLPHFIYLDICVKVCLSEMPAHHCYLTLYLSFSTCHSLTHVILIHHMI